MKTSDQGSDQKGQQMRPSGRAVDMMRNVTLETGYTKHAEGSCMIKFGDTHVLCNASLEDRVPPFLRNSGKGWVTAEYGMLPRDPQPVKPRGRSWQTVWPYSGNSAPYRP